MPGSWSERGSAAVDAGDLDLAKQCFARAVRDECSNARHRFHLAVVLEGLGELAAAARELTQALRLDPKREEAARRLAALFRRPDFGPSDHDELNAVGLRHALNHVRVDQKAIANVAVRVLVTGRLLKKAFATGHAEGWLEAARRLCLERTSPILKDELFLEVLRTSTLSSPELECLLTAIRRVLLLEVAPRRFWDHALLGFAIAMLQQCWINQFVWAVSEDESQCLAHEGAPLARLAKEDLEAGHCVLRHCLYAPLRRVLGDAAPEAFSRLEPRALREVVVRRLVMEHNERERAARMPLLGNIDGATSRRVARFYEESPYPRWSTVIVSRDHRATLARFLGEERAAFLERSFEVLIAGCGTGQQVVQAALHYGPNARILALDLSAASLGYAARMAESFGVDNVEFARADLETFSKSQQFAGRFQLIEAVGVLHHMAEPFAGWRALLRCLAPHGLMRIGLYSAIARRNLTALRNDRDYPGPGCDDQALRTFRQSLLMRQDEQARDARKYVDFWDARSFRDMALHVCEHRLALPEIARFLEDERLAFRGFQLPKGSQAMFWQRFPFETWPGTLENWARLEEERPQLFENMYLFWCEKT
ncbi:MAG: methyltransferase domain-containing protein [Hyphomicrobiaceae bacterium]|nr:methyltransferase domain-containing protein [Hyphomicrobiaceae bacterium]